jgi:hypothetical protein
MTEKAMANISRGEEIRVNAVDQPRQGPSIFRRDGDKVMGKKHVTSLMYRIFIALAVVMLPAVIPNHSWAAVNCPAVIAAGATSALGSADSDGDGLTDFQECSGIVTQGAQPLAVPTCVPGDIILLAATDRNTCLDPDSKDLFVIYKPAATGSLLGAVPRPFDNATFQLSNGAVTFTGLSALGVTVHQITEAQAGTDRSVTSTQKAIKVTESLDPNGTITGNCQWGTPGGLDGCVVFTQRTLSFINSTCDSVRDATTNRQTVFNAYATFIILHETGHTLGGLAATYDSRFGGYHYKTGTGVIMEQSAAYAAKGGKCTFYISSGWNTTLDAPAVHIGP